MNQKLVIYALVCIFLIMAVCAGAFFIYNPYWTRKYAEINQFRTQTAEVEETAIVNASATAQKQKEDAAFYLEQTLTAQPTFTFTPTTPPTSTPIPAQNVCLGRTDGVIRNMTRFPAINYKSPIQIPANSTVKVVGRFEDRGWIKIMYEGNEGWIKRDLVEIEPNCDETTYSPSYLLGISKEGVKVLLDDSFYSNATNWMRRNGEQILTETKNGEGVLFFSSEGKEEISATSPKLVEINEFSLVTHVMRQVSSSDTYIGFRFRDNGVNYYEIQISPSCQVNVFDSGNLIASPSIEKDACINTISFFIEMNLSSDNKLEIRVNGYDPVLINLPDPMGIMNGGTIRLVANNTKATYEYLVIFQTN